MGLRGGLKKKFGKGLRRRPVSGMGLRSLLGATYYIHKGFRGGLGAGRGGVSLMVFG